MLDKLCQPHAKRTNSLLKLRIKSGQCLLHKTKGLYFYNALNAEQYTAQKITARDRIFILFEFIIYVETIVLHVLVFISFWQTNKRETKKSLLKLLKSLIIVP